MFTVNDSSVPLKDGMITRTNNLPTQIVATGSTVPWGYGPVQVGAEGALESFLRSEYGGFETGAIWCMSEYLSMGESAIQQVDKWLDEGKEICINFESIALLGKYDGLVFKNEAWIGPVTTFSIIMDSNNAMGRYSHQDLANAVYLKRQWLSLRVVTDPSGRHSSSEILSQPFRGYGLASYKLKAGDKDIIKVYQTEGKGVDKTLYTKGASPYQVKNEGQYTLKKWAVSEYTTNERGKKASWADVTTGCEPFTQQGTATATVTMTEREKTDNSYV